MGERVRYPWHMAHHLDARYPLCGAGRPSLNVTNERERVGCKRCIKLMSQAEAPCPAPTPEAPRAAELGVDAELAEVGRERAIAHGLALGLEAVRRRERFASWLYKAWISGLAYERVRRFPGDPEAFIRRCAWSDLRLVCECAGFVWLRTPTQQALRLALLASPEWKALSRQWEVGS